MDGGNLQVASTVTALLFAAIVVGCAGEPAADRPSRSVVTTSSHAQFGETSAVRPEPAPPIPAPETTSTSTTAAPAPTVTDAPAPQPFEMPDPAAIDDLLDNLDRIIGDLDASLTQHEGEIFDE